MTMSLFFQSYILAEELKNIQTEEIQNIFEC